MSQSTINLPNLSRIPKGNSGAQMARLQAVPNAVLLHWMVTDHNEHKYDIVGISKEQDSRKCRNEIFWKHIYKTAGPQPTQPLSFYCVALFATDSFALLEVKHLKFCRPLDPTSLEKELNVWVGSIWHFKSGIYTVSSLRNCGLLLSYFRSRKPLLGVFGDWDLIFGSQLA